MTNYENRELEAIFTEVSMQATREIQGHVTEAIQRTVLGIKEYVAEAIEMEISSRWNDIINTVVKTNMPEAPVSNPKVNRLVDTLITRVHELEDMLVGTSCQLPETFIRSYFMSPEQVVDELTGRFTEASEAPEEEAAMDAFLSVIKEQVDKQDIDNDEDPLPDSMLNESIEEDPFASHKPVIEVDEEDPFASYTIEPPANIDDKVHDFLSGNGEFDPFADADANYDILISESDIPPVPDFGPEDNDVPPLEVAPTTTTTPSGLDFSKSGEKKKGKTIVLATYDVFGKEVQFLRENARIVNEASAGAVRKLALDLNDKMKKANPKLRCSEADALDGKFHTQIVREWALEIAAFNGITEIKGDAGAAILVAKVIEGALAHPPLRFRNEVERQVAGDAYRALKEHSQVHIDLVNAYKDSFGYIPMSFVGANQNITDEARVLSGYALLYARFTSTWANITGKVANVFPEVNQEVVGGEI